MLTPDSLAKKIIDLVIEEQGSIENAQELALAFSNAMSSGYSSAEVFVAIATLIAVFKTKSPIAHDIVIDALAFTAKSTVVVDGTVKFDA